MASRIVRWWEDEWVEHRPAWIAGLGLLAVALAVAVGLIVLQAVRGGEGERPRALPTRADAVPTTVAPAIAAAPAERDQAVDARATDVAAPTRCRTATLRWAWAPREPQGAAAMSSCLAMPRAQQRGSVRQVTWASDDGRGWSLELEAIGDRVIALGAREPRRGAETARLWRCRDDGCRGVRLIGQDEGGGWTLQIDDVALTPVAPARHPVAASMASTTTKTATPAAVPALRLQAALVIPASAATLAACPGETLQVTPSARPRVAFCASGGAGFEIVDAGTDYVFRDRDARELRVRLAPDGQVAAVRWADARCDGSACAGIAVETVGDAADPLSERRFLFAGTRLQGAAGEVRLEGGLVMPAQ